MENIKNKLFKFIQKYYYLITIVLIICTIAIILLKPNKTIQNIVTQDKESSMEEKIIDDSIIKVEIKGMVLNPGVYELTSSDRVEDLIEKAGGILENANMNYINLSKRLSDEMVVIIYSNDEIEDYKKNKISNYESIEVECICPDNVNDVCISTGDITDTDNIIYTEEKENSKTNTTDINSKISINSSDLNKLMEIPGIGESKAKSILEYRTNNGNFNTIDDIMHVSGIGTSLFEKIKDYITI